MRCPDCAKLGIAKIDESHGALFRAAESLRVAVAEARGGEYIAAILDQLADYAQRDFEAEESCMREHRYPGYEAHRAQHERFAVELAGLCEDMARHGATPVLAAKAQRRVREWLLGHVAVFDQQLCEFLNGKA